MLRATVQTLKILTIATLAILTLLGGRRVLDYALDRSVAGDVGEEVAFTVGEDDNADTVAERLADEGLIRSEMYFKAQLRFTSAGLLAGDYTLRKGMTVQQIIDRITGGVVAEEEDSGEDREFEVTVLEGWRTEEIAEAAADEGLEGGFDAFMSATETINLDAYEFLADRPQGAGLEGYLFPDTYTFLAGGSEYNIRSMLDNFDAKFTPDMRQRASEMGLTIHEVITLASIIEREAQKPEERPIIADIYLKRLVDGWDLEADPTTQYSLGKPGDWWPKISGADLEVQHPYNTYLNPGLPPGPICNPGLASIQAVLTPAETDYWFFFAKQDGSGEHAFAVTAEEHQQNIELYGGGGE